MRKGSSLARLHTFLSFPSTIQDFCLYSVILAVSFVSTNCNWTIFQFLEIQLLFDEIGETEKGLLNIQLFACSRKPVLPATIFKDPYNKTYILVSL